MTRLIVIKSPKEEWGEKSFEIASGCTIGSAEADSICLHSEKIKPAHVKIDMADGKTYLSTYAPEITVEVNGERFHRCALSHGDLITLEDYAFIVDEAVSKDSRSSVEGSHVDDTVHSQIKSKQKYYDSAQHVIESLEGGEQSPKRLMTLYRILSAISGILDLDHLLKHFLKIILEEFNADRGFIMLVEGSHKKLVPAAVISRTTDGKAPKISRKIVEEVFSNQESILCENILDDTRFKGQKSLIHNNIMSAMCVPLIRKGETLGLIHVDSQQRNKFSRKDLDLITKIAIQAAIVIENARFYRAHEEFNRNLLTLSQATQSISSYLREDLIIQHVTQYVAQIFQGQKSYLFLRKDKDLVLVDAAGIEPEKWGKIEVPESLEDIMEKCCPALYGNARQLPEDLVPLAQPGSAMLAVPISISGHNGPSIGVICVAEKASGEDFTTEDQQLLAILASHTATALSNAKFYQQVKNKEEEIARWNLELEKRVTERTAELKSTQGQLIQSEKMAAVGLLAAGVAHEFNNIIASMYGFAQIAKKNPKYQEKLVDIVVNQSKRGCEITENLLSFSKQRGDLLELVDVQDLVESVLRLTMTALENEGITVVKNYKPVPNTLLNPGKIQQVFLNIIINARHAIEKNGTITIGIHADERNIHIDFSDTGKGIAEENLKRIFEPFYTTKGSFGGGSQPGTGIGLSLCYNIVRQHNGSITASSQVGVGSTFVVVVPIVTHTPPPKMGDTARFVAKAIFGKSILVVEDTEEIRSILQNALEEKNFEVYMVDNGNDAVEMCKKEHFDAIFLDIRMPSMDGFEVFDKVKKLEPNTKVIIITGRAEDSKLMQYVGRADGYLRKPFDIEDIYKLLP